MNKPEQPSTQHSRQEVASAKQDDEHSHQGLDPIEEVVGVIHIVLPLVAAVLIFMLAFIAITLA